MNYTERILGQCEDIIEEFLLLFDFYEARDWDGGDPLKIYYQVRSHNEIEANRLEKLLELHELFSQIFRFLFMLTSYDNQEIIYHYEDYEVEYIGDFESPENDVEVVFELGKCWGEYVSMFGMEAYKWGEAEAQQIKGESPHEMIARLKFIRSARSMGSKKGAAENARIGLLSRKAYSNFVSKCYPNGLEGRTKKYACLDCLEKIKRLVCLEDKVFRRLALSEKEEEERKSLGYLIALTKQKDGILKPYSINSINAGLSNILKK